MSMAKDTTSKLKKKLDTLFSQYVRLSNADKNGFCTCVSCGVKKHYKEMQAGHYISRQHLAVRYDESNVFPQCVGCNVFKHGNYPSYALFMLDKYGKKKLQWLEQQKQVITKDYPYETEIEKYKNKIKELERNIL